MWVEYRDKSCEQGDLDDTVDSYCVCIDKWRQVGTVCKTPNKIMNLNWFANIINQSENFLTWIFQCMENQLVGHEKCR